MIAALGGYLAASAVAVVSVRRTCAVSRMRLLGPLVFGLLVVAGMLLAKTITAGSLLAIGSVHDALILIAWLIGAEVLLIRTAGRLAGVESFLVPAAALLQACAILMYLFRPSGPQYVQQWHILGHVFVISFAGACFVASGVAGAVYLVVHRAMRRHRELSVLGRLPALESLERFGRWSVAVGFPLLTFGILTGICGIAHSPPERRSRELEMASGTIALWILYAVAMLVVWRRSRLRGPRAAGLATGAAGLTILIFMVYLLMRSRA